MNCYIRLLYFNLLECMQLAQGEQRRPDSRHGCIIRRKHNTGRLRNHVVHEVRSASLQMYKNGKKEGGRSGRTAHSAI